MITLADLFSNEIFLLAAKVSLLALQLMYAVFAFIVLRQVGLMHRTFQTSFGILFKSLALIHFLGVVFLILLSVFFVIKIMNKRLTVKTQKLVKTLPTSAKSFASSICIEPEEAILNEKKGTIYTIFDLTSESEIDPLLITKIIHDVLYEAYYESDTSSPIQSLERAIITVREKVINLIDSKTRTDSLIAFNMLASVLWGNVLYMVQFGKGSSFLVRDNAVKLVNSATEGNFSVASGVIKDDDVVVLATQSFIAKYSAEDLISGNVSFSMYNLPETAAAILLKFDTIAELTEEEKIDFVPVSPSVPSASNFSKRDISLDSSDTLSSQSSNSLPKISLTKAGGKKLKLSWYYLVSLLVLLGFVGSVFWAMQNKNVTKNETPAATTEENLNSQKDGMTEPSLEQAVSTKEADEKYKIARVEPKFFYDIKLVDESVSPTELVALDSQLVAADKNSGKFYWSGFTTPKFEQREQFSNVSNLGYFGGDLVFTDSEGYKVYDTATSKVTEDYAGTVGGPSAPYLAFLYGVSGNTLTKYQLLDSGLKGSTWAESSEFENAKSLAIDGNIYVLKTDSVIKYYSGTKAEFSLNDLDKPLNNATKIVKNVDLDNVYIADTGNKRILVTDDKGGLIKQFVAKGNELDDIKSIAVSADEKTLYVLSGTKVFEIALDLE